MMRPLHEMEAEIAAHIQTIYTDIDDTLTSAGLIPAAAFEALWRAREAAIDVVLVTGRPAGWCDHLARMWPVSGVVGENGALAFALRGGRLRRIYAERPDDSASRLEAIRERILAEVAGCAVAADQPYRQYDLAIDIREEVAPLAEAEIDRIVSIFNEFGATAKVSSIHVNGWFGSFDKLTMCERYAAELGGGQLDVATAVYVGDSPNDEPMFGRFPHACGVANVRAMAHRMKSLPRYVTASAGGEGFSEVVAHLLRSREASAEDR